MVDKKGWKEFRDTGMLWAANRILHLFGWAIVYAYEQGVLVDVYPARVKFRGFSEDVESVGFQRVATYMEENAKELKEESFQ